MGEFKGYKILGPTLHRPEDIDVKAYISEQASGRFICQLSYYFKNNRKRKTFILKGSTPKEREAETYDYKRAWQEKLFKIIYSEDKHNFKSEFNFWIPIKRRELRNSTQLTYENRFNIILNSTILTENSIEDIKTKTVQEFVDSLIASGAAKSTVISILSPLRQFFNYCIYNKEYISYNPVDGINIKLHNDVITEEDYLTVEECKQLLKVLAEDKRHRYPYYYAVKFTLLYGTRKSETFGLKWGDIDFKNKTLIIQHTVVKEGCVIIEQKNTKTKSSKRIYPLLDSISDDLKDLKKISEDMGLKCNKDDYVYRHFVNTDRRGGSNIGRPFDTNLINREFKKQLSKIDGLNEKDIHFHSLRHSCVNFLYYEYNFTLEQIASWVGHSSKYVSEKYYLHDSLDWKIKEADRFNKIQLD